MNVSGNVFWCTSALNIGLNIALNIGLNIALNISLNIDLNIALNLGLNRRLGGRAQRPNREIDFGFGSCVRARGLVVEWNSGSNPVAAPFPFPFSPSGFSLFP